MTKWLPWLTCLLALSPQVPKEEPPESPNPSEQLLGITHVTLIDATGAPAQPDMTVVVQGTRIMAVGPAGEVEVPPQARRVDGRGKFLIPGLWDMHVHTAAASKEAPREVELREMEDLLALDVASGITSVRDMGGWGTTLITLKRRVESGKVIGPNMLVGAMVEDTESNALGYFHKVRGPKQARRLVRELNAQGFDFVKVYSFLPRESYLAIVNECRRQELPFVGHRPVDMSFKEVIQAGQRSIEHLGDFYSLELECSGRGREALEMMNAVEDVSKVAEVMHKAVNLAMSTYDAKKCAALYARLAAAHTWQVPTLTVHHMNSQMEALQLTWDQRRRSLPFVVDSFWARLEFMLGGRPKDMQELSKRRYEFYLQRLGEMHRAGVPIMAGSDAPFYGIYPGSSLHDELELLVAAGLSPMEALQAATREPSRYLEMEEVVGTIEVGKLADMVLLQANPLEDIRNTRGIEAVVLHGRLLTRSELEKFRETVLHHRREADDDKSRRWGE